MDIKAFHKNIDTYISEYDSEKIVFKIGAKVRERGYYLEEEFLAVCLWKSRRPKNLFAQNESNLIEDQTKLAMANKDERTKMEQLLELKGVQVPTASALLVSRHQKTAIIDERYADALNQLNQISWTHISLNSWIKYISITRRLAEDMMITPRELDKALFAFNRIHLDKDYKNLYANYNL